LPLSPLVSPFNKFDYGLRPRSQSIIGPECPGHPGFSLLFRINPYKNIKIDGPSGKV
jgi:hypothetical protein